MKSTTHFLLFAMTMLLTACGFHLRGHAGSVTLAFQSVYLKAANETPFVMDLRSALTANKVEISPSSDQATITLEIISDATEKQIQSLSSAGKILEYQLRYRVSLRAYDLQQNVWLPQEEILLMRTLAYDDTQVLAKEQEQELLYKDMRSDAVQQTLRRLSRAKPHNDKGEVIQPGNAPSPATNGSASPSAKPVAAPENK